MAIIKTSELTGSALNWAVAMCEGVTVKKYPESPSLFFGEGFDKYRPSTDWSQGGPIIERERINVHLLDDKPDIWAANLGNPWGALPNVFSRLGPTPLTAAMRCYVASKLGDEVEVPDELLSIS